MNRFVFADSNKCIGCRTCEVACAISHQEESGGTLEHASCFSPRLKLVKTVDVSAPIMCRQCDDAPCAQVCPNNAIVREDGYIKVIQSRCIGCKTCMIACPYGAMNVVTAMASGATGHSALFQREVPVSLALKCDLCAHKESGPECMRVCPTGAITLIDANKLEKTNQSKREEAALSAVSVNF